MNKKQRKKVVLLIIVLAVIILITYIIVNKKDQPLYKGLPFSMSLGLPIYDYSSKPSAVGASDYVFIGRVNKVLRTEHQKTIDSNNKLSYYSHTVYSVDVVKNIKRKLVTDQSIEVRFAGGIDRSNKRFQLHNNLMMPNEGEYYIFLAYLEGDAQPLNINFKELIVSLGSNYNAKDKNILVDEYTSAYKNEIIPNSAEYIWPKTPYTSIYDVDYQETLD